MKREKNCRTSVRGRMAESLQMPPDAFGGYARLELTGNREATVEGCRGIIEYGEGEIALNLGDVTATFIGEGLRMRCMTKTGAVIEGRILSIQFK